MFIRRASVACILAATILLVGTAHAADLTVLSAGAFKAVLAAIQPDYEQASGNRLRIDTGTAGQLTRKIADGEPFSVLIAPQDAVRSLAATLQPGSATPVARVGIGIVVREGAPKPDIRTVAALRQTLLAAPSVAMIDPASGGSSGPAVMALFRRLGIADAVRGKLVLKQGGAVADLVAHGQAALGIHQISEILPVPGVVLAGPLPDSVQTYTTYVAAIGNGADVAAAMTLVAALHDPAALAALHARGMQPPAHQGSP